MSGYANLKLKMRKRNCIQFFNLDKHFNCVPLEVKFSHYGLLCKVTFDYKMYDIKNDNRRFKLR